VKQRNARAFGDALVASKRLVYSDLQLVLPAGVLTALPTMPVGVPIELSDCRA